ncbi:MAG: DUF4430 domain-containing protein [Patescibacteria group bacterium]|nr:DUF4430 domain-containing protein [Patescibacteria group bacterium]
MTKSTKIIIGTGTLFILTVLLVFGFSDFDLKEGIKTQIEEGRLVGKVNLVIDFGEGEIETFERETKETMTAFDLLKEGTEELSLSLETKNYDIGVFIETIGDKKNGQDEKYWLYYINNQPPPVAADKRGIEPGDKVEFRFEKPPF